METSMIVPERPGYLQTVETTGDEFRAGLPGGIALPFLSIRGKEFRVRKGGQEVPLGRELEVVFIAARPTVSKRYYVGDYSGPGAIPRCMSTDGVVPDVPNPIAASCATCPFNVWGSRVTAGGKMAKECQDYKRLIVGLLPSTGDIYPLVFDVPATSLKAPRGQTDKAMMLRDYLGALSQHKINPVTVVTRLGFTGAEYPQVAFALDRYLSETEYKKVVELRTDNKDIEEALFSTDTPAEPPRGGGESGAPAEELPVEKPPVEKPPVGEPSANSFESYEQANSRSDRAVESPKVVSMNDTELLAEVQKLLES